MRDFRGGAALAKEVLHEIPEQLISFMALHGITPNAPPALAEAVAVEPSSGGAYGGAYGGASAPPMPSVPPAASATVVVPVDSYVQHAAYNATAVPIVRPVAFPRGGGGEHVQMARTVSIRRATSDQGNALFATAIG